MTQALALAGHASHPRKDMFDREWIDRLWTQARSHWPVVVRAVTLLLLLRLDLFLPQTDWLKQQDRGPHLLVTRLAIIASALVLMATAFVARRRITTRTWLVVAVALVVLTVVDWLRYDRFRALHTFQFLGDTLVLGDQLTSLAKSLKEANDFANHDKRRIESALDDPLLMSMDPDLPIEEQLNIPPPLASSDPSFGVSHLYTQKSIDAVAARLQWRYFVLAALFALCIASLVELLCSLAPSAILPSIPVRGGVFISYRRDDSGYATDYIRQQLALRIDPEKIFVDQFSIDPGALVDDKIARFVAACDVFLEVIGPTWVKVVNDRGRRLDDPADFVRREIEQAVIAKVPIIPVLVDGASLPQARDLPPSIVTLLDRNAIPVRRGLDFNSDMSRLAEAIALCARQRSHFPPASPRNDS